MAGGDKRDGMGIPAAISSESGLGDFTTTAAVLRLVPLALLIGALSAVVALGLLHLIGLITHLVYYGRVASRLVSPRSTRLGALSLLIPAAGGIVVGLMARYGSERIRGHGIPEALESILVRGSRVEPRLIVLKPLSSAISIGTGGPFGAEGPIIMTGGALGSVLAQMFRLSAMERRALLVAGAAGGMTAVFGTPVAATLLGVELLVFELRPRSMVLIALAAAVSQGVRDRFAALHLLSPAPLFPVHGHHALGDFGVAEAALVGLVGGLMAWVFTKCVYGTEDLFRRLPLHWMWWPAIGGLVVGAGGLIDPRALGVGYDSIAAELGGRITVTSLLVLLVVKLVIWSVALGSGTSGGILAPLLMMGAAMGGLLSPILHGGSVGTWALLGMAATMSGVMRSPFTSVLFAFELTRDTTSLFPLLVACTLAHLTSVLSLRRSILTEKVSRRGFHVLREYGLDPLEALFVRDVMTTDVMTLAPGEPIRDLHEALLRQPSLRRQIVFPVVSEDGVMVGAVTGGAVRNDGRLTGGALSDQGTAASASSTAAEEMQIDLVVAHPDETLRSAADRMALQRLGALPVVDRTGRGELRGVLTQFELLEARERQLEEERQREPVLRLRRPGVPWGSERASAGTPAATRSRDLPWRAARSPSGDGRHTT